MPEQQKKEKSKKENPCWGQLLYVLFASDSVLSHKHIAVYSTENLNMSSERGTEDMY